MASLIALSAALRPDMVLALGPALVHEGGYDWGCGVDKACVMADGWADQEVQGGH